MEKLEHFRHILLFEFNRGANAAKEVRKICAMYGDNSIGESTAKRWSSRFKEGCFDSTDTPRSGRPSGFDEEHLNTLIQNDRELANVINCDQSIIVRHFNSMGKVKKSGVQIPLILHRLAHEHWPFLSCTVTGDEKWCLYAIT